MGPGVVDAIAHVSLPFIGHTVYFPGLITVILPTVTSIVVIRALAFREQKSGGRGANLARTGVTSGPAPPPIVGITLSRPPMRSEHLDIARAA